MVLDLEAKSAMIGQVETSFSPESRRSSSCEQKSAGSNLSFEKTNFIFIYITCYPLSSHISPDTISNVLSIKA